MPKQHAPKMGKHPKLPHNTGRDSPNAPKGARKTGKSWMPKMKGGKKR